MRHGHGTACGYLFLEDWHNAAVAPKHVAKAHRHKSSACLLLKRPDHQLRYPLGGSHDACWTYCLIGGDHDKVFDAVLGRGEGYLPGTEDIVLDGCEDVPLHHGNMLIGGGVIYDRRLKLLHYAPDVIGVRDIADFRMKDEVREGFAQLSVYLKERRLRLIEADQSKRAERCNLAADLRANRAGGAGDHDDFSLNPFPNRPLVQAHGISAQ